MSIIKTFQDALGSLLGRRVKELAITGEEKARKRASQLAGMAGEARNPYAAPGSDVVWRSVFGGKSVLTLDDLISINSEYKRTRDLVEWIERWSYFSKGDPLFI